MVQHNKYRHTYADDVKQEEQMTDLKKPYSSGESSYASASHKWVAIALNGAGGPCYCLPLGFTGRVPSSQPLINTHKGKVLDLAFCPYNGDILATGSDDSSIHIIQIPKDGITETLTKPFGKLEGHQKKVALIRWNREVNGLLASGSYDRTIKIWNVWTSECLFTFEIEDNVFDIQWSPDGTKLAVLSKTKHRTSEISVFDPRNMEEVTKFEAFDTKTGKIFWIDNEHIAGFGYSKDAKRFFKYFNITAEKHLVHKQKLDNASSVIMPHYDEDLKLIFFFGKGDGTVSFGTVTPTGTLKVLGSYRNSTPQKGGCFIPKRGLDTKLVEIQRFLKLTSDSVVPLKFRVPRKSEHFQPDCYPDTYNGKPKTDVASYLSGELSLAGKMSLDPSKRTEDGEEMVLEKQKTYAELVKENKELRARVAELEEKLEIKSD